MDYDENTYPSLRHAISASKRGGYVFCYNAPVLIAAANRMKIAVVGLDSGLPAAPLRPEE